MSVIHKAALKLWRISVTEEDEEWMKQHARLAKRQELVESLHHFGFDSCNKSHEYTFHNPMHIFKSIIILKGYYYSRGYVKFRKLDSK